MGNTSENSNTAERCESGMDRIVGTEKYGENGESRSYHVARSGTLYPADCLTRAEANRAERARVTREVVTMTRPDGTETRATLGRSGLGLAGKILVCPEGRRGGVGLRHPAVRGIEVGNRTIYESKGGEPARG